MLPVPRRESLTAQVVDILHQGLAKGQWDKFLPGERSLSESLQISRSTLHEVLLILQREGWIKLSHGSRTRILRRPQRSVRRAESRIVSALLPEPIITRSAPNFFQISQLKDSLQDAGYRLEVNFNSGHTNHGPSERIQSLVRQGEASCWVLFSANRAVQQWFMDQRVPCLVDGFAHDGIQLPSIDIDHVATARHAVGKFLGAGHRRLAFLTPKAEFAGDAASAEAFMEAVRKSARSDVVGRIAYHDKTVTGTIAAVRALIEPGERWTGILTSDPRCALTVVSYLVQRGMRVPGEVAVIAREHDEFLWRNVPSIAGYEYNLKSYANKFAHLVIALAQDGFLPERAVRILSRFRPGDSFAAGSALPEKLRPSAAS